ncbi:MAG: hypothetical protein ABFR62_14175 [Bacteroidota bacterium]
MKTNLKFLAGAMALIMFISCSKEDENKDINSIEMGDGSFKVTTATMLGVSSGEIGHTAISFTSGTSQTEMTVLTLDVSSFTEETIEGTYSYPAADEEKSLNYWLTNYMAIEGSTITTHNLEEGEVTIKSNGGNNYTVDVFVTMVDGTTFTGTYRGDFQVQFANSNM